jgi:hypothetical protein
METTRRNNSRRSANIRYQRHRRAGLTHEDAEEETRGSCCSPHVPQLERQVPYHVPPCRLQDRVVMPDGTEVVRPPYSARMRELGGPSHRAGEQ